MSAEKKSFYVGPQFTVEHTGGGSWRVVCQGDEGGQEDGVKRATLAREAAASLYVDRAHYLEGYVAGLQDSGAAPRPAGGAK